MFHQRNSVRKTVAILSAIAIWLAASLQALQTFGVTPGRESPEWGRETREKLRALDYDTCTYFRSYLKNIFKLILFSENLLGMEERSIRIRCND